MHNYLIHEGNENSGRYRRGSGKRPFQHRGGSKSKKSRPSEEEMQAAIKRYNIERQYDKAVKGSSDRLEKTRNLLNETSNAFNRTSNALRQESNRTSYERMDLSKMTDQQLRDRINRENLEIQYSKMFNSKAPEISKGKAYVQKFFDVGGDALSMTGSALAIALAIKGLMG